MHWLKAAMACILKASNNELEIGNKHQVIQFEPKGKFNYLIKNNIPF